MKANLKEILDQLNSIEKKIKTLSFEEVALYGSLNTWENYFIDEKIYSLDTATEKGNLFYYALIREDNNLINFCLKNKLSLTKEYQVCLRKYTLASYLYDVRGLDLFLKLMEKKWFREILKDLAFDLDFENTLSLIIDLLKSNSKIQRIDFGDLFEYFNKNFNELFKQSNLVKMRVSGFFSGKFIEMSYLESLMLFKYDYRISQKMCLGLLDVFAEEDFMKKYSIAVRYASEYRLKLFKNYQKANFNKSDKSLKLVSSQ